MKNNQLVILRYKAQQQEVWDNLVLNSAGGTFLFLRDYMEYHAHRFNDYSLMIYEGDKLLAVLPANRVDDEVISHGGLTYGGVVARKELTSMRMLEVFTAIINFMRNDKVKSWIYKCVPEIYQNYLHAADRYALFRYGAEQVACGLSSAIDMSAPIHYAELRRRGIKRAVKNGIVIAESNDYTCFWDILDRNLRNKFSVAPVHTLSEIELLHSRFPEQIKLFTASYDNQVIAGCVVYDTGNVAHAQYISASEMGKKLGALDMLFAHLIENVYASRQYFDFGISTEQGGKILNTGLLTQKEGFGARGVTYETYRIKL